MFRMYLKNIKEPQVSFWFPKLRLELDLGEA